jgi:hypothetical protein
VGNKDDALIFIKNKDLRKTVEDAIDYIYIIFGDAADSKSGIYKEETYRVIILYIVAIIEAILLYVINERRDTIKTVKYKKPRELSKKIKHLDHLDEKLVIAIQYKGCKKDEEIGVQDLVRFMKKNKFMATSIAEGILKINKVRNTFHLSKSRGNMVVDKAKVEKAFSLLYKIIEGGPKALKYKIPKPSHS